MICAGSRLQHIVLVWQRRLGPLSPRLTKGKARLWDVFRPAASQRHPEGLAYSSYDNE